MTEKAYLNTFDELNNLITEKVSESEDEFIEWVESVLILAYRDGAEDAVDMAIDTTNLPLSKLDEALNLAIDGKTYRDRIHEYYEDGTTEEIARVVETEYHRMFNTGGYDAAIANGYTDKEWVTVGDDKVRETHSYLENMRIPINVRFYSFDGDSAMFPGDFSNASNNVNCRCVVKYIKG